MECSKLHSEKVACVRVLGSARLVDIIIAQIDINSHRVLKDRKGSPLGRQKGEKRHGGDSKASEVGNP